MFHFLDKFKCMSYLSYIMQLSVRDVDEDIFREFKAAVVRSKLKLGGALNLAMMKFKAELEKKRTLPPLKPFHGGKGTEHVSEQVDEILYSD